MKFLRDVSAYPVSVRKRNDDIRRAGSMARRKQKIGGSVEARLQNASSRLVTQAVNYNGRKSSGRL